VTSEIAASRIDCTRDMIIASSESPQLGHPEGDLPQFQLGAADCAGSRPDLFVDCTVG